MVRIRDLFGSTQLKVAIDDGDVRERRHPRLPLTILNYTEQAAYARHWNEITEQSRGLIADSRNGRLVARPFRKFWNHNEPESAGAIAAGGPVTVTSKEDGSLGVLYPVPSASWLLGDVFGRTTGEFRVATRGSFASEQALHATEVWRNRYAGRWSPPRGYTALFEIVYPANQIVLDYHGTDDLILLGFVHNRTGRSHSADSPLGTRWPGPRATVLPYGSFHAALADEPQEGVEGYVVHFLDSDRRVKIKGPWYLQMHRLVTGLSARVLWEHLAINFCQGHYDDPKHLVRLFMMGPDRVKRIQDAGADWYDSFVAAAPDELQTWISNTVDGMCDSVEEMRAEVHVEFVRLASGAAGDRRQFAAAAGKHPHSGALFALWDNRQIDSYLWREARPAHELPYKINEGVAA